MTKPPSDPKSAPWYCQAFGSHYLDVYARRQAQAAACETAFALDLIGLEPGGSVLDFCCGPGFHLAELRDRGIRAVGVDLSPELIDQAKTRGPAVRGDMRAVPFAGGFQALLSFFTTIGYFGEEENARVFREINRLLAPAGKFFIDYLNPAVVRQTLVPESERQSGNVTIRETRWLTENRVCKRVELSSPEGEEPLVYTESVRLYEKEEIDNLLREAGLTLTGRHGDFSGSPFSPDSPRMILSGHKDQPVPLGTWKGTEPMLRQIPVGGDRNFAYLLCDQGEAVAIDPTNPQAVIAAAKECDVKIVHIINTHGHYDHADGNQKLREETGATVIAHTKAEIPKDQSITGGEKIKFGSTELEILATPGHTPDSICILWDGKLITGDTLFVGKVGGTATEEAARDEHESLHNVIAKLPTTTEVWPGHDVGLTPSSTVGQELETNPFYQHATFAEFIHLKNTWAEYKAKHGIK